MIRFHEFHYEIKHFIQKQKYYKFHYTYCDYRTLSISSTFTKNAPEPVLGVGVKQGNELVTGELNVSPGTPLTMEIFLDKESAPVYGLAVTYMEVTDTKSQEETIIFNG